MLGWINGGRILRRFTRKMDGWGRVCVGRLCLEGLVFLLGCLFVYSSMFMVSGLFGL